MPDELDLAGVLLDANGTAVKRWGADEQASADVPKGMTLTTADPGLFKDAKMTFARGFEDDISDLTLLQRLRIFGRGQRPVWEGRLQETPREFGDENAVSIGAIGLAARLDDDPSFAEIYLDRDLDKWGEPSIQRLINLAAAKVQRQGIVTVGAQDTGAARPGLIHKFNRLETNAAGPLARVESWYYGNGIPLGEVRYDGVNISGLGIKDPNWRIIGFGSDDDLATTNDEGTNHEGVSASNQAIVFSPGRKYARFMMQYQATISAPGDWQWGWSPVVIGRHGLVMQGAWPDIGFYGHQIIADIVSRCAPDLNFTTGPDGSIEDSDFIIPHAAFDTPGKGSDAIMGINAYHQRPWGVEDDKRFFWRETYRKRWRIRRSRGDHVDLLGPQAEDAINGVRVTFTDGGGQQRMVGPPGMSNAYATSELLVDTDPTNPVNAAGIARKWGELDLQFLTTTNGAIQVGGAWLRDRLREASSRGSVTVRGWVEDEHGTMLPAYCMRAGDSATVVDGDNIERRIIDTSYDNDSRTLTANLSSTPHRTEAMMERMGVVIVGLTD